MREVGSGDDHGINVRVGTQDLGIGCHPVDPPLAAPLLEQLAARIASRHELRPPIELDARHVVVIAHRAGADNADSHRAADAERSRA